MFVITEIKDEIIPINVAKAGHAPSSTWICKRTNHKNISVQNTPSFAYILILDFRAI